MSITVLHKQNLADVTIQYQGSLEAWFDMALLNGISVTDTLEAGTELSDLTEVERPDMVRFYTQKNIRPATDLASAEAESIISEDCGIGCMEIEATFKVR